MIVDAATADDLPVIAEIERETFADPWSRGAFAGMLGQRGVYFAVARPAPGAAPVGYVVAIHAGGEGEIANLAVTQASRGCGVGTALVEASLAEARRRQCGTLFLEVRESNAPARRLYARHGFEEVGRRRGYYRHPTEDALVLRRVAMEVCGQ